MMNCSSWRRSWPVRPLASRNSPDRNEHLHPKNDLLNLSGSFTSLKLDWSVTLPNVDEEYSRLFFSEKKTSVPRAFSPRRLVLFWTVSLGEWAECYREGKRPWFVREIDCWEFDKCSGRSFWLHLDIELHSWSMMRASEGQYHHRHRRQPSYSLAGSTVNSSSSDDFDSRSPIERYESFRKASRSTKTRDSGRVETRSLWRSAGREYSSPPPRKALSIWASCLSGDASSILRWEISREWGEWERDRFQK